MDKNNGDSKNTKQKMNSEEDTEISLYEVEPGVPMDKGWAWFVMLGAFINTTSIILFLRSLSIFLIKYLEKYQVSATLTTLAFGLGALAAAISSILQAVVLLPRYSERSLSIFGSVMNVSATIFLAFSPNIVTFNLCVILIGFSRGFILVPAMALVGKYFRKRLTLAVSVTNIAYSVATIVGPIFTQYLMDTFGVEGGVLILAAVNMQLFVGSMLLRPTSYYKTTQSTLDSPDSDLYVNKDKSKDKLDQTMMDRNGISSEINVGSMLLQPSDSNNTTQTPLNEDSCDADQTDQTMMDTNSFDSKIDASRQQSLIEIPSEDKDIKSPSSKRIVNFAPLKNSIDKKFRSRNKTVTRLSYATYDIMIFQSNHSITKAHKIKTNKKTSLTSIASGLEIYKNPKLILLILASGLGIHGPTYYGYTPVLGIENGLTEHQSSLLLTIAGICDLVSKLLVGCVDLADLTCIKRIQIAIVTQILIGALLQFVSFYRGYLLMIVLQIFGGACVQCFFNLLPSITSDILSPDYIAHLMSGYFLLNGIMQTLNHVFIGVIKDATNSFHPSFQYLGGLYLLGACLLLAEPLVGKYFGGSAKLIVF